MPLVNIPNAGAYGMNRDLSDHELPLGVWTDVKNIRFLDGYAHQAFGHGEYFSAPSIVPFHIVPVTYAGQMYWLYAGAQKIYVVEVLADVSTHTNLTRQTAGVDVNYSGAANSWTSTLLSGIPILNPGNTVDYPQQWDLNTANRCTTLANWPVNTYCKVMRAFKNYLIALNVTKNGFSYPYMVKWSHPAAPGAVPLSWDEADPTKDARETDLSEGNGAIIDGLPLRDSFLIYREGSIHRMDWTGGRYVFRFQKVLGNSGALNRNCIVEIEGMHVVLTNADIIVHDGTTFNSILDKNSRRWLFQNIDIDGLANCFLFKNLFFNEVYICFPQIGSTVPDRALVWNFKDKTVSIRELPNVYHAAFGPIREDYSGVWAADEDPWEVDDTVWGGPDLVPSSSRVHMVTSDSKIYMLDAAYSFAGAIPDAYLERKGLSFGTPDKIKLVRGIRPRIVGHTGTVITIKIGTQNDPFEDPVWAATMTHTIGTTVENHCLVSGRYIAIRFEANTAYKWRLDSFDVDVQTVGNW